MKNDLRLDGYASRFILLDMDRGPLHRDGAGVLAIRAMLQAVRQAAPALAGALLIGDFPEAMLVRSWAWRRTDAKTINNATVNLWLRVEPEIVADRSDIVLQDLTGQWKTLYNQGPTNLDIIHAAPDADVPNTWPQQPVLFRSSRFTVSSRSFQDFFYIRDERIRDLNIAAGRLTCRIDPTLRHPELGVGDALAPNPIARPEIHVSRINPRHIAADPQSPGRDLNGQNLLAADGRPTTVTYPANVGDVGPLTVPNAALERRLLIEYLDRNHRWRNGLIKLPQRAHVIAYPLSDFSAESSRSLLAPAFGAGNVVTTDNAIITDYTMFLRNEAPLKMVVAHSNGTFSHFGADTRAANIIDQSVGGRPWRWVRGAPANNRATWAPTMAGVDGHADIRLHRTLWANNLVNDRHVHFLIHHGCQVNSPQSHATLPYFNPAYGRMQNAESLLLHTGGLAVLSRAKVFYDAPRNAVAAFAARRSATFGDGLAEYFRVEPLETNLGQFERAADSKRAYTWSIIGDWSLRLKPVAVPTDELSIDIDQLMVVVRNGKHIVSQDKIGILACSSAAEAQRVIAVLRHYRIDRVGYVNRPNPSLTYWLSNGSLPTGRLPNDDVLSTDLWRLRAFGHGGRWYVGTGPNNALRRNQK